jgi:hypothetical protein
MDSSTRNAAEAILTRAWRWPVRLGAAHPLTEGRLSVWRVEVDAHPIVTATVIVKHAPADYDPGARDHGPAARLFDEWAGLRLLGRTALTPRLFGGDRAAGLLVLEDLGPAPTLDVLLLARDRPGAEAVLVDYMRALGRIHAATVGRAAGHARLRRALGPVPAPPLSTAAEGPLAATDLAAALHAAADALGVTPVAGTTAELDAVMRFWADPGPFLVYTHGDPCPDNCLLDGPRLRFVDFELGAFRHALIDGVYPRLAFPSCWCAGRLPPDVVSRLEALYRAELARGCPAASDDMLFARAVVEACAYWTLATFRWAIPAVLESDDEWGTTTLRPRVLFRLDVLAEIAASAGHLKALGATAAALAAALRRRWPDLPELPPYPAFA